MLQRKEARLQRQSACVKDPPPFWHKLSRSPEVTWAHLPEQPQVLFVREAVWTLPAQTESR